MNPDILDWFCAHWYDAPWTTLHQLQAACPYCITKQDHVDIRTLIHRLLKSGHLYRYSKRTLQVTKRPNAYTTLYLHGQLDLIGLRALEESI